MENKKQREITAHPDLITAMCNTTLDAGKIIMSGSAKAWQFASHADVALATQQAMALNGVWSLCTAIKDITEQTNGKTHYYSAIFEFTWTHNGSATYHKTYIPGVGQDVGDKAPVKALVMADKYNKITTLNLPRVDKSFEPDYDDQPKTVRQPARPKKAPQRTKEDPWQILKQLLIGKEIKISDHTMFCHYFFEGDWATAETAKKKELSELTIERAQELLEQYKGAK